MTSLEIIGHPLYSTKCGLVSKVGIQAKYDRTEGIVAMALLMLEAQTLVEGIISIQREKL